MTKFSPGPWRWVRDELENQCQDRLVDGDGRAVLEVPWMPVDADSRLIAAAPEMYELLKMALTTTWEERGAGIAMQLLARFDGEGAQQGAFLRCVRPDCNERPRFCCLNCARDTEG